MARRDFSTRVSIVVPHLGDDHAFEDTLVSVLENRPTDSDVWVVHDGGYDDPFDLGDEVQFLTSRGGSLPELIATAADAVQGRFIHVLGAGVRATAEWTDHALLMFEQDDAAVVAPVAKQTVDGPIVAAGWTNSSGRLVAPLASGKRQLGRRDASIVRGACLTASFWRREELLAATHALTTDSVSAAQFAWSRLLCRQGWRCLIAEESIVLAEESMLGFTPSMTRGATLRSLVSAIEGSTFAGTAMSVGLAAFSNLLKPRVWGEITGEALSLFVEAPDVRALQLDEVSSPEDRIATIRIPQPVVATALRRAA